MTFYKRATASQCQHPITLLEHISLVTYSLKNVYIKWVMKNKIFYLILRLSLSILFFIALSDGIHICILTVKLLFIQ